MRGVVDCLLDGLGGGVQDEARYSCFGRGREGVENCIDERRYCDGRVGAYDYEN
jgi:hypothetical protein